MSERFGLSYLLLVAESPSFGRIRKVTRVMVSKRRGYIFIQTDQPIYTPAQNGKRKVNKSKETKAMGKNAE